MAVMNIQWNNCGSVLAVAGMQRAAGQVNGQEISDNCNIHSNASNHVFYVLSPGQMTATLQRKISQHYWMQHVVSVLPAFCDMLEVVGSSLKWSNLNTQHVTTGWSNMRNIQ